MKKTTVILARVACAQAAFAQGTAFTYQGRLGEAGATASGSYDLRFSIHDLVSGGSIVGGPITNAGVNLSNGLFMVSIDLGAAPFDGSDRWLESLPTLAGLAWLGYYWHRHKAQWQWPEALPSVLLVSVTTSFFAWTYDQVVFLPAIIQGASWLVRQRLPWYQSIAALLYVAIDLAHGAMRVFVAEELWYFWLAPALLVAYLIYCRESLRRI